MSSLRYLKTTIRIVKRRIKQRLQHKIRNICQNNSSNKRNLSFRFKKTRAQKKKISWGMSYEQGRTEGVR